MIDELSLDVAALGTTRGVVIADVASGTPAEELGLHKGDVVLEVNGAAIHDTGDLVAATAAKTRAWDLTLVRGGQTIRTRVGF